MSEIAIQVRDLGKAYRLYSSPAHKVLDALSLGWLTRRPGARPQQLWALKNLNVEIRRGERVGFVGRNGAGKSTLLKIICGNVTPTEGNVAVTGKVQALLELGTGFHPEFSGRQNIRSALAFNGVSTREIRQTEGEIIDFSELEDFIDQPVTTYSAGMYARLAFSTATAIKPEILIIDEILGAGDAYFAGKCIERMRRLTDNAETTVLFVSHDLSSVHHLCERTIWIEKGNVMEDGRTVDVIKSYYRSIQREEALRQKARSCGVRKIRDSFRMTAELEKSVIFHFVPGSGRDNHPRKQHLIRAIRLLRENAPVAEIIPGAPEDNLADLPGFILDDEGFMDWSKPACDDRGPYRRYEDRNGSFNHAPFVFRMSAAELQSGSFRLHVEGEFDPEETVRVEAYLDDAYQPLGDIHGSQGAAFTFPLPHTASAPSQPAAPDSPVFGGDGQGVEIDSNQPGEAAAATASGPPPVLRSIVSWKEADPRIDTVRFLNAQGEEVAAIEELEDFTIEILYSSSKRTENPVFALTIFQACGVPLCHANTALAGVPIPHIQGSGSVRFDFPEFVATAGEYLLSCSIFEYLDPFNYHGQPPYYDQHDKAYRFKVWKKTDHNMSLGAARLPFHATHTPDHKADHPAD